MTNWISWRTRAVGDSGVFPFVIWLVPEAKRKDKIELATRRLPDDTKHGILHVRQQVLRIDGQLQIGPVKTKAGRRDLPLPPLASDPLLEVQRAANSKGMYADTNLVFTTRSRQPVEPQNLYRSFKRIC